VQANDDVVACVDEFLGPVGPFLEALGPVRHQSEKPVAAVEDRAIGVGPRADELGVCVLQRELHVAAPKRVEGLTHDVDLLETLPTQYGGEPVGPPPVRFA
jgi:hypothetical protein